MKNTGHMISRLLLVLLWLFQVGTAPAQAPASISGLTFNFTILNDPAAYALELGGNTFTARRNGVFSFSGTYVYSTPSFSTGQAVLTTTLPAEDAGDKDTFILTFSNATSGTFEDNYDYGGGDTGTIRGAFTTTAGSLPGPMITTQPQSQTVNLGQSAAFSVTATGTGLTYLWYHNGVPISGATLVSYTILSAQALHQGAYTVVVRGSDGGVTSSTAATLTVSGTPPTNPDGNIVGNPEWQFEVSDFGYSDEVLDKRPGFEGREYLSGEWAAGVLYSGGQNPAKTIWFEPQWKYPDWASGSDFGVHIAFYSTGTNNATGFPVYHSAITNRDLRVDMTYQMIDTITGIPRGQTPKSQPGPGTSTLSTRYVYKQTYTLTNISNTTLSNLRFFQFLHGLDMTESLYDDRSYSGAMSDYHYVNTQIGNTVSLNTNITKLFHHRDVIGFHARVAPTAWEVGYYGKEGTDSHEVGKPSVGVHLKVEADNLNSTDYFSPPEERWVSGAQRFNLGNLVPGAAATIDVLFSLQTISVNLGPPIDLRIRQTQVVGTKCLLDFEETTGNSKVIGYQVFKTAHLGTPVGSMISLLHVDTPNKPGWKRIEIPYSPTESRAFFIIKARFFP